MQTPPITITAMGHGHPDTGIFDNDFFTSLDIDTDRQWIEERTGIVKRHSVLTQEEARRVRYKEVLPKNQPHQSMTTLAKKAWTKLQERSPVPEKVDFLISGCDVLDYDVPAQSSLLAHDLEIPIKGAFDVKSACSSFLSCSLTMKSLLSGSNFSSGLVFNVERYTLRMDYSDRSGSILFGDGGACALFSHDSKARGLQILDLTFETNPLGAHKVMMPYNHYFHQDGGAVQKFAVQTTCQSTSHLLAKNGLKVEDIRYFVFHQANLRMLMSVCEKLHVTKEQHLFNVDQRGNQGAAGAPSVLSEHWDMYKPGDLIIVTVVGAGLSWGSMLLRRT